MDVVALAQLGFPNAVATLGTACTADHVQKLFRFTDSVVFSFDGDAAGRRAARKALDGALPYATDVRSVKFLFLPAEHDPDSFIREFGADAFARFVSEATPLSALHARSRARRLRPRHAPKGRAHMASNARPLWSALPEGALKRQLLGEIAELVQLSAQELGELWRRPAAAAPAPGPARASAATGRAPRRGEDRYAPRASPAAPARPRPRPAAQPGRRRGAPAAVDHGGMGGAAARAACPAVRAARRARAAVRLARQPAARARACSPGRRCARACAAWLSRRWRCA